MMRKVTISAVLAGLVLPGSVLTPSLIDHEDESARGAGSPSVQSSAQRTHREVGTLDEQAGSVRHGHAAASNGTSVAAAGNTNHPVAPHGQHLIGAPGGQRTAIRGALNSQRRDETQSGAGENGVGVGGDQKNRDRDNADQSRRGGQTKAVEFAGYRVEVPRSWPVYRLADDPTRCVRFDRHAVYLGRPADSQRCPAKAVGKTAALLLEPLTEPPPADAVVLPPNQSNPGSISERVSEEVQVAVTGASVLVTATYGASRKAISRILASATLTSAARTARKIAPNTDRGDENYLPGKKWHGKGFDTCSAPSTRQMRAWLDSPYRGVGIYIGGASRACANSHLSASWVSSARGMGWNLLPIYVGRQAPCNGYTHRINPLFAARQGRAEARDAASDARELGIGFGNPIYFDMEAYNSAIMPCRQAVLRFLSAWTEELHRLGYTSGVYSSAASGARDLGLAGSHITKPDNIWFAHWDGRESTSHCSYLSDNWWDNHERVKQYRGGHPETHGGVTLNIDNNMLDADVVPAKTQESTTTWGRLRALLPW